MAKINRRNQTGWRRLAGWGAAYLLVLHLGFAGASTGHFFVSANEAASGTAFCLNGAEAPASPADQPAHPSHGKVHCVLCTGGGSLALAAASFIPAPAQVLASTLVPASDRPAARAPFRSSHQSRAPPLPA